MKRLHVEHANLTILGDVNPNLGIPQNPLDMVKSCEVWELVPSDIWMLVKYGEILCRPMEVRALFYFLAIFFRPMYLLQKHRQEGSQETKSVSCRSLNND